MSRKKNTPLENESAVENTPDAQPETAEAPEAAAEQTEPAAAAEAVTAEQVAALEAELAAERIVISDCLPNTTITAAAAQRNAKISPPMPVPTRSRSFCPSMTIWPAHWHRKRQTRHTARALR